MPGGPILIGLLGRPQAAEAFRLHPPCLNGKLAGMETRDSHCFQFFKRRAAFRGQWFCENIITEADSWEELRTNVTEAVSAFFFDSIPPARIRLRLVRKEKIVSLL